MKPAKRRGKPKPVELFVHASDAHRKYPGIFVWWDRTAAGCWERLVPVRLTFPVPKGGRRAKR